MKKQDTSPMKNLYASAEEYNTSSIKHDADTGHVIMSEEDYKKLKKAKRTEYPKNQIMKIGLTVWLATGCILSIVLFMGGEVIKGGMILGLVELFRVMYG